MNRYLLLGVVVVGVLFAVGFFSLAKYVVDEERHVLQSAGTLMGSTR